MVSQLFTQKAQKRYSYVTEEAQKVIDQNDIVTNTILKSKIYLLRI